MVLDLSLLFCIKRLKGTLLTFTSLSTVTFVYHRWITALRRKTKKIHCYIFFGRPNLIPSRPMKFIGNLIEHNRSFTNKRASPVTFQTSRTTRRRKNMSFLCSMDFAGWFFKNLNNQRHSSCRWSQVDEHRFLVRLFVLVGWCCFFHVGTWELFFFSEYHCGRMWCEKFVQTIGDETGETALMTFHHFWIGQDERWWYRIG